MHFRREGCARYVQLALLLLYFLALVLPAVARAQNNPGSALNLEISPLPIELNTKPGIPVSADLRVRNSGNAPERLKASLKTFSAEGTDGHLVLHDPNPEDDYTNWVSFDKPVFDAPPGQWQTVKMTVSPPKTAAFGYYYAVQFELANPPKPQPGATSLQGAVVIFVLLNADAPGASKKINVTSFTADHQTYEFLPVNFNIKVHNSGNLHVAPHGNIFIRRGSHQVASLAVNPTQGMVLPSANRVFNSSWNDGFPAYISVTDSSGQPLKDASGNLKKSLKWNFSQISHLRFGHYRADLLLIYNDGQRDIPISGSLSFWVIPWRLTIMAILIPVVPSLLIYLVMKRRMRKLAVRFEGKQNDKK
jgi:hypothetical protein